jgi:serine/threonine protein kinase
MLPNNSSALIGRTIAGKFVIESMIAVGGIGTVYRARQLALDRIVALKVLHAGIAREEQVVERFKREARAASRLDHPNSVRVLDFGQDEDSLLYLAMEYVEGRTLYQVIQEDWPLGDNRIVDILSQVLAAVGVAHDMGVIHRDLKPENIIILRGRSDEGEHAELAKVCDFGLATLGAAMHENPGQRPEGPRVTARGSIVGTPEYMSPEQVLGQPADQRSDLYAAGVILYQMLAKRLPFDGQTPNAVAVKHVIETPIPPSTIAPVNRALEAICLKAMSKEPHARFESAREMRNALRATLMTRSTTASFPGATGQAKGPSISDSDSGSGSGSLNPVIPTDGGKRRRLSVRAGIALAAIAVFVVVASARLRSQYRQSAVDKTPALARAEVLAEPRPATTAGKPSLFPAPSPLPVQLPEPVPTVPADEAPREPPTEATSFRRSAIPGAGAKPTRPARDRLATGRVAGRPAPTPEPTASAADTVAVALAEPHAFNLGPAAPTQPAAAPIPARVDIDSARVSITGIVTTSAIVGSNVRAAMNRIPVLRCYREALRDRGTVAAGTATLHLNIDSAGYVTAATLLDAKFLPGIKACIERVARAAKIKDVDTGEATADVTLNFVSTS